MRYVKLLMVLVSFAFLNAANAQEVEVQGKLKVTDMEVENNEDMLVTKKSDGTLATRNVNSLPTRSFSSDTSRTLGTDMELAKQLCNCGTIPPFLVESMLDAGYSIEDLLNGGVNAKDLYEGGASLSELHDAGLSPYSALNIPNITMLQLLNAGYQGAEFYGEYYQGGLIFQVNSNGTGIVMTNSDVSTSARFGCEGTNIPAATSADGQINTDAILAVCGWTQIAAWICDRLHRSGYSDWYLPSSTEWINAYNRIGLNATGALYNRLNLSTTSGVKYWSSRNWSADYALASSSTTLKNDYHRVRAVRKF